MSNATNIFDFSAETLAQFLAKSVGDGTYDDIFGALKSDRTGYEADATGIAQSPGQLWANGIDDFVKASYPTLRKAEQGRAGSYLTHHSYAPTVATLRYIPGPYTISSSGSAGFFQIWMSPPGDGLVLESMVIRCSAAPGSTNVQIWSREIAPVNVQIGDTVTFDPGGANVIQALAFGNDGAGAGSGNYLIPAEQMIAISLDPTNDPGNVLITCEWRPHNP